MTVIELVWAWTADCGVTLSLTRSRQSMRSRTPASRADLARVRHQLTTLHRRGWAVRTGRNPSRWQPFESSNAALDDSVW